MGSSGLASSQPELGSHLSFLYPRLEDLVQVISPLFELQLSLLQDERGSLAPQHCLWTRNNIYRVSSTKQDLINSG